MYASCIPVDPRELAQELAQARELLLMCDYDGTLVSIAPTPEQAKPSLELLAILDKLVRFPGRRVAVISGRKLSDLEKLLPLEGVFLAGCHGAELKEPGGKARLRLLNSDATKIMADLEKIARKCMAGYDGFLIENKSFSLALHYRLANPTIASKVLESFIGEVSPLLAEKNLELLQGKKVLEVRPKGLHKGIAVKYLLQKFPQALPAYIGDDQTDEDAFAALKKGYSILVSLYPRPSKAKFRLPSTQDVLSLLKYLTYV